MTDASKRRATAPDESPSRRPKQTTTAGIPAAAYAFLCLGLALFLAGCTASHYRKSADKESYRILQQKEQKLFGHTNAFTINTPYSSRDPKSIKALEIIDDRLQDGKRKLTLEEALKLAVENSRSYQLRKETLYLAALTLTREQYEFSPKLFGKGTASTTRETTGDRHGDVDSQIGVSQLLKTGARLSGAIANDIVRYFTGSPRREAVSVLSVDLAQPLLRGAGASVVAENLTQAERNVVYELRSFTHFQKTFAVDIVTDYFRILQQKDAVRNGYDNYTRAVLSRERAEARSVDRGSKLEADQALQQELSARSSYISAAKAYKDQLDAFKIKLGISLGIDIRLADTEFKDLENVGLIPVVLDDRTGYRIAVEHHLELMNEIDRFEDSKRKIIVAANQLKADVNLFANASLESKGPTDYTRFNSDNYRGVAGIEINLPIDRLKERNNYRAVLIAFERELRALSLALDNTRNDVLTGTRELQRLRENYRIQLDARDVADRRVESTTILFDAGRVAIRDLLEAQSAQVLAQNAVTRALVDYHVARMNLLIDIGMLDTNRERFWLVAQALPGQPAPVAAPRNSTPAAPAVDEVVPPDKLFGTE